MTSDPTAAREPAGVEEVDGALETLATGNFDVAQALLLDVIANTPSENSNCEEDGEGISNKFWDQTAFIHYLTWQKDQEVANKPIIWIGNAYPRAHYYMGFLCVKRKDFDQAIDFLDKGQSLEPTNPKFTFEKAQALVHSGRKKESLALYDQVMAIGPHVSAFDLAVARRGSRSRAH